MKTLLLGFAASLAIGAAYAQTTAPAPVTTPMATPAPMAATTPATGVTPSTTSGNSNQAVATTHADEPMPAKGANSFTMSQASSRLQAKGFTNVTGLAKDADGVWRGRADKDGTSTNVWVDYKGNVGSS
jgi:hypothetical protein